MRHVPGPRNRVDTTPREPSPLIEEQLLVRLVENVGPLPSGFIIELPAYEATRLVYRRLATVVGSLGVIPDLVLTEQEFEEAIA